MRYLSKVLFFLSIALLLTACETSLITRAKRAELVAINNRFSHKLVKTHNFWLTTYQHITNKHLPYVVYIEGDGLAFKGRYQISEDPTPTKPMMLALATIDPRPNVVYIARPCQYTPKDMNPSCNQSYWTDKRMSEEVVASINEAIGIITQDHPVSLVGFSGGGGVAVLVAARNNHVKDIITIAGNLDHVSFNKHHNTKPMLGSLNPIDYASRIRSIPQLHVSGGKDKIVPPFIADGFVSTSRSPCVHQEIIPNAEHYANWDKYWNYILNLPLTCYKG